MAKFNQIKLFIILLSILSIGSGKIFLNPCYADELTANKTEISEGLAKNKRLAADFQLLDTEGKIFKLSDYQDQILVLSFLRNVDNKRIGTYWMKENRQWLEALQKKYQDDIVLCSVKEMTDIPRMLPKSFIRSTLNKETFRFLIDWEGDVFEKYVFDQLFTLLVIDRDGAMYFTVSEEFDDTKFVELCSKINGLIINECTGK